MAGSLGEEKGAGGQILHVEEGKGENCCGIVSLDGALDKRVLTNSGPCVSSDRSHSIIIN